jgi:hypothetical protein
VSIDLRARLEDLSGVERLHLTAVDFLATVTAPRVLEPLSKRAGFKTVG